MSITDNKKDMMLNVEVINEKNILNGCCEIVFKGKTLCETKLSKYEDSEENFFLQIYVFLKSTAIIGRFGMVNDCFNYCMEIILFGIKV